MVVLANNKNIRCLGEVLAAIICVLCYTVASTEVSQVEEEVLEAWKLHVAEFHDGNAGVLLRPDRFCAFQKSFRLVKSHNQRYAAGEETFTMKLNYRSAFVPDDNPQLPPEKDNQASRLQSDGVEGSRGTTRNANREEGCRPPSGHYLDSAFSWKGNLPFREPEPAGVFTRSEFRQTKFRYASIPTDHLPTSVDWRPLFNKIHNQHEYCGDCWAASSTAAIESTIKLATEKFVHLSIQQPVACSPGTDIPGAGWKGGWPEKHLEWVAQHNKMAFEETNSTVYRHQACRTYQKVDATVTAYGYVPRASVAALKAAVSVQPIVVYIKAEDSLEHYDGGIYSPRECGKEVNHAALLVGYGIDWKSGNGYWIVQNSWGEAWGEGGYFRVAITEEGSDGICGMLVREPVFPIVGRPWWKPLWDACLFRPCGGGTCMPWPFSPGSYSCESCPHGFYVHRNSDGTQTCAPNPCEESYVCSPGQCQFDPDANYGYTCQCKRGSMPGAYTTGAPTCTLAGEGARVYALQAGDTCERLARRNNFTLKAFKCINPNIDCLRLKLGHLVSLGNFVSNSKCTLVHTVGERETCETVQEKFGLSLDEFRGLNPGVICPAVLPTHWQLCVKGETSLQFDTLATEGTSCGKRVYTDPWDDCWDAVTKAKRINCRLTEQLLIHLNPGLTPRIESFCSSTSIRRRFDAGTELCVSPASAQRGVGCPCTIQTAIGDTSLTISIREQISLEDLFQKNPDVNFDLLQIGQALCVQ